MFILFPILFEIIFFFVVVSIIKKVVRASKNNKTTMSNSPKDCDCDDEHISINEKRNYTFCEYCGAKVEKGKKKCSGCGAKLDV